MGYKNGKLISRIWIWNGYQVRDLFLEIQTVFERILRKYGISMGRGQIFRTGKCWTQNVGKHERYIAFIGTFDR